jgi:hypothetical protein
MFAEYVDQLSIVNQSTTINERKMMMMMVMKPLIIAQNRLQVA